MDERVVVLLVGAVCIASMLYILLGLHRAAKEKGASRRGY